MDMDRLMLLELLFIFVARIIDMALGTLRIILTIKGDKWTAALIGFFEIMVYTVALGMVVGALHHPVKLVVFCLGFSGGVVLGSIIEGRLALGYREVQITIDRQKRFVVDELRALGYPVTCWEAQGKDGDKLVLSMALKRQAARRVTGLINDRAPEAFIVFTELRFFRGGMMRLQ